ncbi:MAG: hypothetical protein RML46_06350 [Anaerolineae bacterium]|nr:hypothetical protein [Anaerolineae bacterium]MDW8068514.1 hypothetical protein [Anaerolineae bacterium]
MKMDAATTAVIVLSVFLLLWYIIGHLYNRRHGLRLFQWLEQGLATGGNEYQWRWLGSPASGARILVYQACPPFRRIDITLLLENREIPLLWLAERLQKKRDAVIIQATLHSPGSDEIQAGWPSELRSPTILSWARETGPYGLIVAYRGPGTTSLRTQMTSWLTRYGKYLRRFALRREDPHLVLWIHLNGLAFRLPASVFFTDLQAALEVREAER